MADLSPGLIILEQTAVSPFLTPENSLPEVSLGQESVRLSVSGILLSTSQSNQTNETKLWGKSDDFLNFFLVGFGGGY